MSKQLIAMRPIKPGTSGLAVIEGSQATITAQGVGAGTAYIIMRDMRVYNARMQSGIFGWSASIALRDGAVNASAVVSGDELMMYGVAPGVRLDVKALKELLPLGAVAREERDAREEMDGHAHKERTDSIEKTPAKRDPLKRSDYEHAVTRKDIGAIEDIIEKTPPVQEKPFETGNTPNITPPITNQRTDGGHYRGDMPDDFPYRSAHATTVVEDIKAPIRHDATQSIDMDIPLGGSRQTAYRKDEEISAPVEPAEKSPFQQKLPRNVYEQLLIHHNTDVPADSVENVSPPYKSGVDEFSAQSIEPPVTAPKLDMDARPYYSDAHGNSSEKVPFQRELPRSEYEYAHTRNYINDAREDVSLSGGPPGETVSFPPEQNIEYSAMLESDFPAPQAPAEPPRMHDKTAPDKSSGWRKLQQGKGAPLDAPMDVALSQPPKQDEEEYRPEPVSVYGMPLKREVYEEHETAMKTDFDVNDEYRPEPASIYGGDDENAADKRHDAAHSSNINANLEKDDDDMRRRNGGWGQVDPFSDVFKAPRPIDFDLLNQYGAPNQQNFNAPQVDDFSQPVAAPQRAADDEPGGLAALSAAVRGDDNYDRDSEAAAAQQDQPNDVPLYQRSSYSAPATPDERRPHTGAGALEWNSDISPNAAFKDPFSMGERPTGVFTNAFSQFWPYLDWHVYRMPNGSHYLSTRRNGITMYAVPGPPAPYPPAGIPERARYIRARNGMAYWVF